MAQILEGRTDNDIKNKWYSMVRTEQRVTAKLGIKGAASSKLKSKTSKSSLKRRSNAGDTAKIACKRNASDTKSKSKSTSHAGETKLTAKPASSTSKRKPRSNAADTSKVKPNGNADDSIKPKSNGNAGQTKKKSKIKTSAFTVSNPQSKSNNGDTSKATPTGKPSSENDAPDSGDPAAMARNIVAV